MTAQQLREQRAKDYVNAVFGSAELERCPYCGGMFETPCDEPPPDTCAQALEKYR